MLSLRYLLSFQIFLSSAILDIHNYAYMTSESGSRRFPSSKVHWEAPNFQMNYKNILNILYTAVETEF